MREIGCKQDTNRRGCLKQAGGTNMMVARDVTSCTWRQTYCHVVSLYRQGVPKCIEMQLARQESMHLLHLSLIIKEMHAHIQTYIMCLYTHRYVYI